jgi:putative two-component system response regulator
MEAHPVQGADLLKCYPDFARIVEMVRHHHERWDGTGYPSGLTRADIPFGARIVAVAESFDAMTTDRSYRRALSKDRAAEILCDGRGRQWDPSVVDAFLRSIGGRLEHPMDPVPVLSVPAAPDAIGSVVPA